jgi:hypothetical protein
MSEGHQGPIRGVSSAGSKWSPATRVTMGSKWQEPRCRPHAPEYDGPWMAGDKRCTDCGGKHERREVFWSGHWDCYLCERCASRRLKEKRAGTWERKESDGEGEGHGQ